MSFISEIVKWFHDAIMGFEARVSKLEQHNNIQPAAASTPPPPAQVVAHLESVTVPGSNQQISGVMANILGVNQQTSDTLNSRVGQVGSQVTLDPRVIYYNHHTVVENGAYTCEPLQGKSRLSLTYTSQDPGKTAPTSAWVSVNGGPEQGPLQTGVEAQVDLGDSGTPSVSVRFDTNGRMIGQLFKG